MLLPLCVEVKGRNTLDGIQQQEAVEITYRGGCVVFHTFFFSI